MRLSISEVLALANSKKSINERAQVLWDHNSFALRHVLRLCFQPEVKWLLPEGDIQYTIGSPIDQEYNLYGASARLYLFLDEASGGNPALSQERREALFVQFLESLDKKDAELMVAVKDKKMPYKRITKEVVLTAFQGLWPEPDPVEPPAK